MPSSSSSRFTESMSCAYSRSLAQSRTRKSVGMSEEAFGSGVHD